MNEGIDGLLHRLKKIAEFSKPDTYYSVAMTPNEAAMLVERLTAANGTASEKQQNE